MRTLDFAATKRYVARVMHDFATRKPTKAIRPLLLHWPVVGVDELVVRFQPGRRLSNRQLERFCALNPELRIEETAEGELIVMPPVSSEGSHQNFNLTGLFFTWAERVGGGRFFDSSGGFRFSNKAMRSPDVSWVAQSRLDGLHPEDWKTFMPLCPDFALELRSRTDRLPKLHAKMAEYIANGTRLGWLIDPQHQQVFVYRPGVPVEHLLNPATLSGEPVLAGFTLDLARVW